VRSASGTEKTVKLPFFIEYSIYGVCGANSGWCKKIDRPKSKLLYASANCQMMPAEFGTHQTIFSFKIVACYKLIFVLICL